MSLIGIVQVVLINADMTRLEQSGPQRFALAGDTVAHFVPSILTNFQRAQAPANTVSSITADDPRHSAAFVDDKRALERWTAFTGLALAILFIGLEETHPEQHGARALADGHGPVADADPAIGGLRGALDFRERLRAHVAIASLLHKF